MFYVGVLLALGWLFIGIGWYNLLHDNYLYAFMNAALAAWIGYVLWKPYYQQTRR